MEKVLLVCGGEKTRAALSGLTAEAGMEAAGVSGSAADARRQLLRGEFDLVLISLPLPGGGAAELAAAAAGSRRGVVAVVRSEEERASLRGAEKAGAFVLVRPLSRKSFCESLRFAAGANARLLDLLEENRQLRDRIGDLCVTERAKNVLMSHLGFTEDQAHRYIEKQAMDRRCTRRSVAEGILNTYE